MSLTKEQQIEILMKTMSESSNKIAAELDKKYGTNITHDTVAKAFVNFEKTGCVEDLSRSGGHC